MLISMHKEGGEEVSNVKHNVKQTWISFGNNAEQIYDTAKSLE